MDDELLGNTAFNALLDRVTPYRQSAEQVYEETGHPAIVPHIVADLGYDVMLGLSAVNQGHPDGAAARGRAMYQAIDAVVAGVPLAESAKERPELSKALELWGE